MRHHHPNSTFDSNVVHMKGYIRATGVAYLIGISSSRISHCDFTENGADNGGMLVLTQSSVSITDSNFSLNSAEIYGGIIAGISESSVMQTSLSATYNRVGTHTLL